jgi:hypothetical protein
MSTPIKDGGPAFPEISTRADEHDGSQIVYSAGGMSLRDYFAGQALAGLLGSGDFNLIRIMDYTSSPDDKTAKAWAVVCYKLSDAMLAAREAK